MVYIPYKYINYIKHIKKLIFRRFNMINTFKGTIIELVNMLEEDYFKLPLEARQHYYQIVEHFNLYATLEKVSFDTISNMWDVDPSDLKDMVTIILNEKLF